MLQAPLRSGGFSNAYDLSFSAAVSTFQNVAATVTALRTIMLGPQRVMSYLGISYKIESVDILAGGQVVKITANSLNQNA